MSRKKAKEDDIDTNSWLGTYSDTITLLLTFFVLLYSYSSVDAQKFQQISSALQGVFNGKNSNQILDFNMNNGEVPVVGSQNESNGKNIDASENVKATYEKLQKQVKDEKLDKYLKIKVDSRGYIFEIKDKILFETGKADLKPDSIPVLDFITKYIEKIPNEIIIEGHTDNVPISNYKYKDNIDLSSDRANNVTRFFINNKKVDPKRIRPMGLGEYHPIVPNNSDSNRAKNRRVNVLIVTNTKKEGK
ncbi:OmpA family protein [Hathewaya massiliensis]|uniref:OmpA family protein n=1 Tax=Hathewaya massiliensis TaxID=1964382 RepID=UPI0011579886|nr:OmpA family protein [Hathewaya massiliensis]